MSTPSPAPRIAPSPPLLEARGIACARGERLLVAGFDLALYPGDLVWLRAPNGFGKTSLLRVLAGLAAARAGRIDLRAPLLYLAHANALKEDLTIAESVDHFVKLFGLAASPAARTGAVRRFGLEARRDAPVRTLSQGQRRRVALTRLCLSPPGAVWLLDEPYDALDADGAHLVSALLSSHAGRGGCALLTSHVTPSLPTLRERNLDTAVAPAQAGFQSESELHRADSGPGPGSGPGQALRRGDGGFA